MSAASGSFAAKAGYNQSGGGYYITTGALQSFANFVIAGQSGSGGATVPPQLSTANTAGNFILGLSGYSTLSTTQFAAGKVIRDMGKTIVSSSRTFRKFQAVIPQSLSTGGVTGAVGGAISAADTGYLDFYLEVTQGGAPNGTAPPIARTYF